jgi:hypothetical protein
MGSERCDCRPDRHSSSLPGESEQDRLLELFDIGLRRAEEDGGGHAHQVMDHSVLRKGRPIAAQSRPDGRWMERLGESKRPNLRYNIGG